METEGLRASELHEREFREQQEKTRDDARWITGQVIVAAGGKRM